MSSCCHFFFVLPTHLPWGTATAGLGSACFGFVQSATLGRLSSTCCDDGDYCVACQSGAYRASSRSLVFECLPWPGVCTVHSGMGCIAAYHFLHLLHWTCSCRLSFCIARQVLPLRFASSLGLFQFMPFLTGVATVVRPQSGNPPNRPEPPPWMHRGFIMVHKGLRYAPHGLCYGPHLQQEHYEFQKPCKRVDVCDTCLD